MIYNGAPFDKVGYVCTVRLIMWSTLYSER